MFELSLFWGYLINHHSHGRYFLLVLRGSCGLIGPIVRFLEIFKGVSELSSLVEDLFREPEHLSNMDAIAAIYHTLLHFVEHGQLFSLG